MLDLKYVCQNLEEVDKILQNRSGSYDVPKIKELNDQRKLLIGRVEALKSERNSLSSIVSSLKREKKNADAEIEKGKALGASIKELDEKLAEIDCELASILLTIPNLPHSSVPVGKDDSSNVEIRHNGVPRAFSFTPKPHWELGEAKKILDQPSAAKITGARFTVYRDLGARLERSIMNFMLDTHTQDGFTEIFPPFMVNRESMTGTGQLPKFEEDAFAVKNTNYFLVPTAEVPVTNLHRNEILDVASMPIYYTAYTACFRAEAGSAGRDTRGLIRQHQFNKVELVKFCLPENSYDELESLTLQAEKILKLLDIPYRVVALCTGDLGFSSAKTYDIEVWMPSYNRYVEISSCSNFEDFQARRMNIKYRDNSGKLSFVHTLNGSGLAIGRTTAAIMENFQNEDGTIDIPKVLLPYMRIDKI